MRLILTGGQVHDIAQAEAPIRDLLADHLIAGEGDDSSAFVAEIEEAGPTAVIPPRSERKDPREHDAHLYRERNQVERLFGRLEGCRWVATRYEKTARNYLAFSQAAAACRSPAATWTSPRMAGAELTVL